MEVHRQLGHGFLEAVYQDALAIELEEKGIPFQREVLIEVCYKRRVLASHYRADFICYDQVLVELKALNQLTTDHQAQVMNYLKATGLKRGLLINFGAASLDYKRLVWGYDPNSSI